jgi:DNA-binding MarR family transcriptional regulator
VIITTWNRFGLAWRAVDDTTRVDLLALLMPIGRDLRRAEEAAAARHGITMWQYAILAVVDRRSDLNQSEVAARLGYSKNRIVGDLDRLEQAKLLVRRPGADRRANTLAVTPRGRRVMTAIRAEIHRHEDDRLATLSTTTRRAFVAALVEINDQLRTSR